MNYATQHYIGNHQNFRTEKATEITPTVRRVRLSDAKTQRCKRSTERQTEIRTCESASNGILKCTFLPKLKETETLQDCKKSAKTERDFYKSLSNLAEHYGIETMNTKDFGFPYNIALAMWDMDSQMKQNHRNWDGFKLVQDNKKSFLITEEKYDTGTTLYYIPVIPLFKMSQEKEHKHNAHLLISVCSYLYHIANIPYYTNEETYLYWQYEMHKDWVEDDYETEDTRFYKSELKKAEWIGSRIEQKLFNRMNLTAFEQRLNCFKSRSSFDHKCWQIACNAFALYREYPNANIFRNAQIPEEAPYNEDYDDEIIGIEKYISFISNTKGWLYESITEGINNEFNEYKGIEEPTVIKQFDGSEITTKNLDFETRLFELLDDLCGLLYHYKKEEK